MAAGHTGLKWKPAQTGGSQTKNAAGEASCASLAGAFFEGNISPDAYHEKESIMTTTKTRSAEMAAEVTALLRARTPLIVIRTNEEARVESWLVQAAAGAAYVPRFWDCGQGCTSLAGVVEPIGSADIGEMLTAIKDRAQRSERGVYVLRDVSAWLAPPIGLVTLRQLCNLARFLPGTPRESAQAIILLTPSSDNLPQELMGHVTILDWPSPDRAEISKILDAAVEALPDDLREQAMTNGTRDAAIDAALGLSGSEAQSCYAKSLVQLRKIDPVLVAQEKKRVIAREGVLIWEEPLAGGLDSVGGLDGLKQWLVARASAYSAKARAYGLPTPRGAMLVGVPGCGKTMTARAVATAYGVPLLRLDLGALKSKFVGASEGNLRKALKVIESVGRCVVFVDEVEKALAGATQGAADGGVSSDALGTLLTWMSDRVGQAFVLMTANAIESLPPELTRKGRFDELFFIDLPNTTERMGVLSATLRKHGRGNLKIDTTKIAAACEGFTGSEIAEIVPDAMFAAFADGEREITNSDLINAAATVVPLSKTASEKIDRLRTWAKGRARPASLTEAAPAEKRRAVRVLDI
jgi:hypothetical protein